MNVCVCSSAGCCSTSAFGLIKFLLLQQLTVVSWVFVCVRACVCLSVCVRLTALGRARSRQCCSGRLTGDTRRRNGCTCDPFVITFTLDSAARDNFQHLHLIKSGLKLWNLRAFTVQAFGRFGQRNVVNFGVRNNRCMVWMCRVFAVLGVLKSAFISCCV